MIPAPQPSPADLSARVLPPPRLPLSKHSRRSDQPHLAHRPHLQLVSRPELGADTATELDRRLRALSGRAARCRLAQGWLAATLLKRNGWIPLGFVRLGDYTSERLGIGARILEEEARVALCLRRLPQITAAFLDGTLTWTAVRLIATVATVRDEDRWIAQAFALDTRALSGMVRAASATRAATSDPCVAGPVTVSPVPSNSAAGDPHAAELRSHVAEDDEDDPRQRWVVRVSHDGRRLWRAACEMASRAAGVRLTPAQVLEQVAAEVSSDRRNGVFERAHSQVDAPSPAPLPTSSPASSESPSDRRATGAYVRGRLVELVAAELERSGSAPDSCSLPFLNPEDARELEERDPQLAAFFVDMLTDVADRKANVLAGGPANGRESDSASRPAPPEYGWFEKALRGIGHAEGFAWLTDLSVVQPSNPSEKLEAELRAIEDADPHIIDARLREVRGKAQALDFELANLLREAAGRRLHRAFGFANFEEYVQTRLGFSPRTAWGLLSIGRAAGRSCPRLGEAWKSGRISTLAARVLLPVLGSANAGNADTDQQWIARAAIVTLRRLEAEVSWALDRRDQLGATRASAGDANSTGDSAIAPPPLDLDLTGHALAAVTADGLQMRAQADGPDPAAGGDQFGVAIAMFAPQSVIFLVEHTIHGLRRGFESRGRAFERMLALAMLEWMAAPRHPDPVFERDGWNCAVPACRSRRNLHDHHIVFRSNGGDNALSNRVTVCAAHHLHGIHRGRIRASGKAPHAMLWEIGCRFGTCPAKPLARLVGDRYLDRD